LVEVALQAIKQYCVAVYAVDCAVLKRILSWLAFLMHVVGCQPNRKSAITAHLVKILPRWPIIILLTIDCNRIYVNRT